MKTKIAELRCSTERDFQTASALADRLAQELSRGCERLTIVGALRRKASVVKEIRFLAIPRVRLESNELDLFGAMTPVNELDEILQQFQKENVLRVSGGDYILNDYDFPVKVIRTHQTAWASMLFQHTGKFDWGIVAACVAKSQGLKWWPEAGGFVDRETNALVKAFSTEEEVLREVHKRWVEPQDRNHGPRFDLLASGMPLPISQVEARVWGRRHVWVDSKCGGDPHQFTLRVTSPNEREFVRMVEMIEQYGYDEKFKRRMYRHLDLDGFQYFTMGSSLTTCNLINRKRIRRPDKEWQRNPVQWKHWPEQKSNDEADT